MTTDTKYNGWTNYDTWLVPLWVDNEFESYQARLAYLTADQSWTAEHALEFTFSLFPTGTPDHEPGWLNRVNWAEIAGHWQADHLERHGRE